MKNIHIFTGHYGSGKTEIAINFAIKLREQYDKVYIVDLDIVNPYFRTVDARNTLEPLGIEVLASEFAGTNVDIPSLPAEILKVFSDPTAGVVFDVGGDDDGAIALGPYNRYFRELGYELYVVANTCRPMTAFAGDVLQMLRDIEAVSRLRATALVSNTNLAGETTLEEVAKGVDILRSVSEQSGVPLRYICAEQTLMEQFPPEWTPLAFPIHRYLRLVFEQA